MILLAQKKTVYKVSIDRRIEKDLEDVPNHIVKKFIQSLDEFEKNPIRNRPGFDVKHLKGFPGNLYRLRVGDYRVLYSIDKEKKEVKITMIVHRKKAYN